jgi:ParB family chromosome partitioning protein
MTKTKRLGRGLEALLGPSNKDQAQQEGLLREVDVDSIVPNPWQPRREFNEDALADLASSIKSSGLIQPPVVRSVGAHFELIAGERRFRAIQRLGWKKVPVVLREVDDQGALTLALIENLQRDDLSPIDTALGYQQLMGEFGIAQTEVARLVGRNRSTIANTLRLLKLPDAVQVLVQTGELSEGHARALLALEAPAAIIKLAREAAQAGWSVRHTESVVRGDVEEHRPRGKMMKKPAPQRQSSAEARRVEEVLRKRLGTDIRLTAKRRGRGLLTISYYSNEDLARLLELILDEPFAG